jgi:DNA-binding response OmpR family regulator
MTNQRLVLGLGPFGRERRLALVGAAREAACHFELCDDPGKASSLNPHAILIDAGEADAEKAAMAARADVQLMRVPVLALYPELGDLSFATAFSWGADDALAQDKPRSLIARLRALPREAPGNAAPNGRGAALVADADPAHRIVFGRVLRNAGYQVRFAVTQSDTWQFGEDNELQLIVLSTEIEDAPRNFIEHIRKHGSRANCVVNTPPRTLRSCRNLLQGLDGVTASDSYAPVENVLFLANELRNPERRDLRSSARALYGTTVAFRGAGRHEDDYGFTYNISGGGMYVRTLAVPEDDSVWIELCPPRSERRVRLVAHVQWRRRYGYNENATVPPGFGAKIVDGAAADVEGWAAGYKAMAETLG